MNELKFIPDEKQMFMLGFGAACGLSCRSTVEIENGPWSHYCRTLRSRGDQLPEAMGYDNGILVGRRFNREFCNPEN